MVDVKLDDRMAFFAWVEGGSLDRASKLLANNGIYNKSTGENFHCGSIRQASNRFILNNVEEAREIYTKSGSMLNSRQWEAKLILAACRTYSRKRFIEWSKENIWALKYPMLIDRRFPGLSEILIEDSKTYGN